MKTFMTCALLYTFLVSNSFSLADNLPFENLNLIQKRNIATGTSHGGGGFSILVEKKNAQRRSFNPPVFERRNIREFRASHESIKGWVAIVEPKLKRIGEKLPLLEKLLRKKAEDTIWYKLPIQLLKLSAEAQGVPLKQISLYQDMINYNGEIFVDDSENISESSQGLTLFHEIIMSTLMKHPKYFKFFSDLDVSIDLHKTTRQLEDILDFNIKDFSANDLIAKITERTDVFTRPFPRQNRRDEIAKAAESGDFNKLDYLKFAVLYTSEELAHPIPSANPKSDSQIEELGLKASSVFKQNYESQLKSLCDENDQLVKNMSSPALLKYSNLSQLEPVIKLRDQFRTIWFTIQLLTASEETIIKYCEDSKSCDPVETAKKRWKGSELAIGQKINSNLHSYSNPNNHIMVSRISAAFLNTPELEALELEKVDSFEEARKRLEAKTITGRKTGLIDTSSIYTQNFDVQQLDSTSKSDYLFVTAHMNNYMCFLIR